MANVGIGSVETKREAALEECGQETKLKFYWHYAKGVLEVYLYYLGDYLYRVNYHAMKKEQP